MSTSHIPTGESKYSSVACFGPLRRINAAYMACREQEAPTYPPPCAVSGSCHFHHRPDQQGLYVLLALLYSDRLSEIGGKLESSVRSFRVRDGNQVTLSRFLSLPLTSYEPLTSVLLSLRLLSVQWRQ